MLFALSACDALWQNAAINGESNPTASVLFSTSFVSPTQAQIPLGTSLPLTITLKESRGGNYIQPDTKITLSIEGGTSSGTFGDITDAGDGTYSTLFTSTTMGSAAKIVASVRGIPLAGTSAFTVVPAEHIGLAFSAPSILKTNAAGSVQFTLTYTNAAAITLADADITLVTTGTATCTKTLSGDGLAMRVLTLSACTGTGSVAIQVAAGSAKDTAGGPADGIGPSASVQINNTAPANATALAWVQTSPATTDVVTASWTKSVTTELATQKLQFYSDATCTLPSGTLVDAAMAATKIFTGSSGVFTYKITTVDNFSNTNTSACSTGLRLNEADAAHSTVAVSNAAPKKTQTSTITVTLKDRSSVTDTIGGYTVTFAATAHGTIGAVSDHSDGTYTATYTASSKGGPDTITASVAGLGALSNTASITVANTAPSITPLANSLFPLSGSNPNPPLLQGSSATLASTSDADSDSVTLGCTYQTLGLSASDPNYAASGTNCSTLQTLKVINSTKVTTTLGTLGNSLVWAPTLAQRGTFEFTLTANDGTDTSAASVVDVSVNENSTQAHQLSNLDALFATYGGSLAVTTPSSPNATTSTATSWLNIQGAGSNGSLHFTTTANPWRGTGQASTVAVNPYSISFSGVNDYLDANTALSGATKAGLEAWVKPASPATPATVIAGNGGGTGNGLVLRQSSTPASRAEFVVGQKYYSYRDLVLADRPVAYYRLNDTNSTAQDLSASGNNGAYGGTYSQSQTGAITGSGDNNSSTLLDGTSGYITATVASGIGVAHSFETWVKLTSIASGQNIYIFDTGTSGNNNWIQLYDGHGNGHLTVRAGEKGFPGGYFDGNIQFNSTATWYHIVVTTSSSHVQTIYVNGVRDVQNTITTTQAPSSIISIGRTGDGNCFFNGAVDEYAVYNYELTQSQITNHFQTGRNGNYLPYPGNAVLADHAAGYWRLGEKSGTRAVDLSGNNNDGIYNGGVTLGSSGPLSQDTATAAAFDGSTATVQFPNTSLGSPTTFSIEWWMRPTSCVDSNNILGAGSWGNFLSHATSSCEMYIGTDVATRFGPAQLPAGTYTLNSWQQFVFTFNNGAAAVYKNGILIASKSGMSNPADLSTLGTLASSNNQMTGSLGEISVYSYALAPTQITSHYNAGNGPGWWYCQSQTSLSSSHWNFLQGVWDGSHNTLYVNGQQECQVTPGAPASSYSGAAHVMAGSDLSQTTTSFWQGLISQLSFFGTNDGVTNSLSAAAVKNDFDTSANRYRKIALENIVTNNLVLNLDAANAEQGLGPLSDNTCLGANLNWWDLSKLAANSTLLNFGNGTNCTAASGWSGNGSVATPYAINFDGSDDFVAVPAQVSATITTAVTIEAWIYATSGGGTYKAVISEDYDGTSDFTVQFELWMNNGRMCTGYYPSADWGTACPVGDSGGALPLNQWVHMAASYDGHFLRLYRNGVQVGASADRNEALPAAGPIGWRVGRRHDTTGAGNIWQGSIAAARIYSSALSVQDIKQNCLAQEHRFTSTAGTICAAP